MTTSVLSRCVTAAAALILAATANAQDLVVTNGRILDGTGKVIERGSLVVRGGKIVSVSASTPAAGGARTIDAGGKTVMPGLIDAHRHLVQGDGAQWLATRAPQQLQEFLDAGFTTVLSAIDPPQLLEARNRINQGQMRGPRLYAGVFVPVAGAAGGGGGGPREDPARTDPARGPIPAQAAPAIPHDATIKAVETVDQCLARVLTSGERAGARLLITADHGNCEMMIDPETGGPHTAHTTNPVPFIVVDPAGPRPLRGGGALCDVGPTLLTLLGLEKPTEMTGVDLRQTGA